MDSIGERRNLGRGQPGWVCEARVNGVKYEVWLIVIHNGTSRPDTWGAVRKGAVEHKGPVV